jgi:poly(3-hydroxybutyrate) depolymerase
MSSYGNSRRLFVLCVACAIFLSGCRVLARRGADPTPLSEDGGLPATPSPTEAPPAPEPTAAPTLPPPTAAPTEPPPTAAPTAEPTAEGLRYEVGLNTYTLMVDNTPREVLVYVPAAYDPATPAPVVIIFHGSNGSGRVMYENTRWAARADEEGILIVYPSSWAYRLIESGRVEEKWNTRAMADQVVPGTELKDDVKFTRVILDRLAETFNVDARHLYATGFSNGGGFVLTRLMVEMADVFAAYATCGAGLFSADTDVDLSVLPTGLNASVFTVLGTNDEKVSENTGHALPLPIRAEDLAADPLFAEMFAVTTHMLSLDPNPDVVYAEPAFNTLTYDDSLVGAGNQYIFRMVNRMGHVYPNGVNNRYDYDVTPDFWAFFQQYER